MRKHYQLLLAAIGLLLLSVATADAQFWSKTRATSDTQIMAGPGIVHALVIQQTDAAPTAGSIALYDNTAESGTVVWEHTYTTAVFQSHTIPLDVKMGTGAYLGFTTTADVAVTVLYDTR